MERNKRNFLQSYSSSFVICTAMLLLSANTSRAGLTVEAIGDPIPGGSWFHDFHVSSTNTFSNVGLMVNDDYHALKGEPSMDFSGSSSDWHQFFGATENETWSFAGATGSSTDDINWRGHFSDPVDHPFSMSLFAYDDHKSNEYDGVTMNWDGSHWSYHDHTSNDDWQYYKDHCHGSIVPLPGAVLLGMFGLGTAGVFRRRLM